jgi:glycerol-3-phosphate dehydrogenase (NAD(P)+)
MTKILVIGGGAWGTAIADLLAGNKNEVVLCSNDPEIVAEINKKNTNEKFLPGLKLNSRIKSVQDYSAVLSKSDFVFIVTPSTATGEVFKKISKLKYLAKGQKNCVFVICSKGIEQASLKLLSDSFERITEIKNYAVLSGPNFATEVANKIPSITTIASKNKKLAQKVIALLNNENFKASYFKDPRTVEICGVVKNILAIGCGIVDGLELGVNTKSALIMKGISEIQMICKKLKASDEVNHAAGFGDIFLTCSSSKSRNNNLGNLLASGKSYSQILQETKKTYEGVASASAISAIAKKLKLKLDLCEAINEIITKKISPKEIRNKIVKAILN